MSETKRRLLYFCGDRGIPYGGTKGSSIHMREFVETLSSTDYSPTVLVTKSFSDGRYVPSVPIHSLNMDSTPNFFHEMAGRSGMERSMLREVEDFNRNQVFFAKLFSLFNEEKFDLIYERYSLLGAAGLVFARQVKIPFVLEVNAPLVKEASQYRNLYLIELAKHVERYLFTHADHIVTVSNSLRDYVLTVAPKARVTAIPNGVDLDRFRGLSESAEWRAKVTADPAKDFVIGFIGSIKPWHGVELLVDALAELVKTDRSFSLCLVGNADQVKEDLQLRAQAKGLRDRLTIVGAVSYEDVPAMTRNCDVLVAPYPDLTDFYFSPLKVFEYMAAGKPIVASGIGQLRDILVDGETALLTIPGDRDSLCAALLRLKSDSALRANLASSALQAATRNHSWKSRMETAVAIFDKLLKQKGLAKEVVNES